MACSPVSSYSHPANTASVRLPRAILFVNESAFAGVCAWCADKEEADLWCREQGLQVTHSICPTCRARLKNEYDMIQGRWVA